MKEKITVLIADDNTEFAELLKDYMSQHDDISVLGVAKDGLKAIDMIVSLKPEVVILDVIMPNLDGLAVLRAIVNYGYRTQTYI